MCTTDVDENLVAVFKINILIKTSLFKCQHSTPLSQHSVTLCCDRERALSISVQIKGWVSADTGYFCSQRFPRSSLVYRAVPEWDVGVEKSGSEEKLKTLH